MTEAAEALTPAPPTSEATRQVGWYSHTSAAGQPRNERRTHLSRVHRVDASHADQIRALGSAAGRRDVLAEYERLTGEHRLSARCGVPVPPHAFVATRLGSPCLAGAVCSRCADPRLTGPLLLRARPVACLRRR